MSEAMEQEQPTRPGYARFVILAGSRTGSNMLATALNTHPRIICFRDLFNQRVQTIGYFVEGYDNDCVEDRMLRDRDEVAFLNTRVYCQHPDDVSAVGFKAMYGAFAFSGFPRLQAWLVQERDVQVLHLRRRNLLRRLVSAKIAEETQVWAVGRSRTLAEKLRLSNIPGAVQHPIASISRLWWAAFPKQEWKQRRRLLTLTPEECGSAFRDEERRSASFAELFTEHNVLDLYYEELTGNQNQTLAEVQRFLGVEPMRLTPKTLRQNQEPLRELIANYDDLRAAFRGTADEAFFE